MKDIIKKTQTAYDRIVLEYAKRNHNMMPENLAWMAKNLIKQVSPNGHILEVGCGTGRDMAYFESLGATITGIDLSWGMLSYARRFAHRPLCQANMLRLPFVSEYFDGVWCCASLLHLPKQAVPQALAEIFRALENHGMLMLVIQKGAGEGWEDSCVPGDQRFFARYSMEEMSGMLTKGGFSVLSSSANKAGQRDWLSYVCLK